MHICNYCGRVLKNDYDKCPGCGGSSFKNKAYLGEEIIKTPPKDGYKINLEYYKKKIIVSRIVILIFITMMLAILFGDSNSPVILFVLPLFGITIFQINAIRKLKAKKKVAEKLAKYGILVKNIPYQVYTNSQFEKCLKVSYKNSAGVEIPLISEPKHNLKEKMKKDDTADLLIDPEDYSNYFIDFEIY